MGLFDRIKVEVDLPMSKKMKSELPKDLDIKKLEFQTKDLDSCMLDLVIRKDKFLYKENVEGEFVDDPDSLLGKTFKRTSSKWSKFKHLGNIRFYSYDVFGDKDVSIEYVARVVDGYVENIKLKEYSVTDNTERMKQLDNLFIPDESFVTRIRRKIKSFLYNIAYKI